MTRAIVLDKPGTWRVVPAEPPEPGPSEGRWRTTNAASS